MWRSDLFPKMRNGILSFHRKLSLCKQLSMLVSSLHNYLTFYHYKFLNKFKNFLDDCPCQFYDCETGSNPTNPVPTSTTSVTSTTTTTASATNTSILILYYGSNQDQYVLYPDDGKSQNNYKLLVYSIEWAFISSSKWCNPTK